MNRAFLALPKTLASRSEGGFNHSVNDTRAARELRNGGSGR